MATENQSADDKLSKELEILARQQEADSEDEYLSDGVQVVDANDVTDTNSESLDLNLKNINQKIWLIRLPRFLSSKLKDKSNLKGQRIGKIKVENVVGGSRKPKMKMELIDDENISFSDIPHEYDLQLTKDVVQNQYVFTEDNLKNPIDDKLKDNTPAPVGAVRKKKTFNKYQNIDGTQKTIPFVRTIPKKTAILGKIVHECLAAPSIRDPNYAKIIEQRKRILKEEPRPTVTLLNEKSGITFSTAGLSLKSDNSSFLQKQVVKNKNEGRAIRMPQKDLFDILFKLFDEYDYWSLKGIKERTKQPEVYLKETLEQIAVLIKKGPYALRYALKKEYKELKDQERAAKLGELGMNDDDENEEEENEDDIEMEDVV